MNEQSQRHVASRERLLTQALDSMTAERDIAVQENAELRAAVSELRARLDEIEQQVSQG